MRSLSLDWKFIQVILLCTRKEAKAASELVLRGDIDDYFVFKPIYEPDRLHVCVHHAIHKIRYRKVLSESNSTIKTADNFFRDTFYKKPELEAKSEESQRKMVQGVEQKLDEFEHQMSGQEFKDTVNVLNQEEPAEHFYNLKNRELQQEFESFKKDIVHSISSCFDDLKNRYGHHAQDIKRVQQRQTAELERYDKPISVSVLIVEDNPQNIELLTAILESDGHKVIQVNDGKEAVVMASKNPPDLIFMDIMLPGIDGIEMVKRFKDHPRFKDIPIMMITAHSSVETVKQSRKAGAVDFIAKPIQREVILEKIRNLFRRK